MISQEVLTGNAAAAYGAKLARAEVVAAYPITPQTALVEKIQELINSGQMKAEYINVESEHSVMAACVGASIGGARAFTATSAQGLLLMQEMLFWAGYGRLPIVMAVVNRAIAPPWSMWSEHTDALAQRDAGWIQIFCQNSQEIIDTIVQAYKIGEDRRIWLPVMVCYDGFEISHTSENLEIPEQADVDSFLPRYENDLIDPSKPKLLWNGALPEDAVIFKRQMVEAFDGSLPVIDEAEKEFERRFGRRYDPIDLYGVDEKTEILVLAMGSVASGAKAAVDVLKKEENLSVGLARVRLFRPFPAELLRKACKGVKAVVVLDRDVSFGRGILSIEAKAALYGSENQPRVHEYFAGLGGVTIRHKDIVDAVKKIALTTNSKETNSRTNWLGVKNSIC